MRMRIAALLLALSGTVRGENILSNTDHVSTAATASLTILGIPQSGGGAVYVDQTCPSGSGAGHCFDGTAGNGFQPYATMIANALNSSQGEYLANSTTSTGTPNTHVPYKVINQSSTGYTLAALDQANYAALTVGDLLYEIAFCGTPKAGDYPAIAVSTVLPSNYPTHIANGASGCGYGTGIEFSMTPNYMGFPTGSPSGTTEAMSALWVGMRYNHPTWPWGDIKGAMRQTASNWVTGYTSYNAGGPSFGFGNVDYTTAVSVAAVTGTVCSGTSIPTSVVCLQGPGMQVTNRVYYATITLYPFKTSRRAHEVIYSVSSSYTWPVKNEYTTSDITASGATLLYTSNGTDATPTFEYAAAASGTITFVAFTTDGVGGYSRVENFSEVSTSLVLGTACTQ